MYYTLHTLSKNNLTCFSGTMTCCTSYYQTQDGCLREPFLRLTFENHFFYLTVNPDFYFDNSYWILLLSFLSIVKRQKSSNQSFKKKGIIKVFYANMQHRPQISACIGATGVNCSTPCPDNYFGTKCMDRCQCSTDECDKELGCYKGKKKGGDYKGPIFFLLL